MLPSFRKIVLSLFSTLFILSSIAVTVVITNDTVQKQVIESFAKTTAACAGLGSPTARKECEAANEASADTEVNQAYRNAHPKEYPAQDSTGNRLSNSQQIDLMSKFANGDANPKVAKDIASVCKSLNSNCGDLDKFVLTKIKTFTKDKDTIAEFTQKIAEKKAATAKAAAAKAAQIALIEKNRQIAARKLQDLKDKRIDAAQAAAKQEAARELRLKEIADEQKAANELAQKPQAPATIIDERKEAVQNYTTKPIQLPSKTETNPCGGAGWTWDGSTCSLSETQAKAAEKQIADAAAAKAKPIVNNYAACNGSATCNKAMTVVDNTVVSDTYKNYWQGQNAKSEGGANLNGLAATMFSYTPIGYTAGLLGYKSKAAEDYKKIAFNSGTTLDTIDTVTLKTFKPYVASYQKINQQNGGGANLAGLAGFTTNLIDRSGTLTDSLGLTNAATQYTKLIGKGATDRETLSATTKLGTVLTLEAYAIAVAPQLVTTAAVQGGAGAAVVTTLGQVQVVSTVYQAGDAASYCAANGWDLSCQKATGRTMLNFATLGTSQFASKSLSLGTKLLNTGVSATNLGIDSVDAVQIFQDKNSSGLSKAMAIAALAGDVGGGIADFNRGELGFSRPISSTTSESLTNALTTKLANNVDVSGLEGRIDTPVANAPVAAVLDNLANRVNITPNLGNLDAPAPVVNRLTEVRNNVTDWLSTERAKINPDAFANTGRDLSNAVENARVGINRTVENIANGSFADTLFGRVSIGDTDIAATYRPVGDIDVEGSVVRVKTDGTVEIQQNHSSLNDNQFKPIKNGDRVFGDGRIIVVDGKYYAFFGTGSLGFDSNSIKLDESGFRIVPLTEGQQSKSILELLGLDKTNQLALEKSLISLEGKGVLSSEEIAISLLEEGYKPKDINLSTIDDIRNKIYDDKLAKSRPQAPVGPSQGDDAASSVSNAEDSLYRLPDSPARVEPVAHETVRTAAEPNQNTLALGWNAYVVRPANAVADVGTRVWNDWVAGPVNRLFDDIVAIAPGNIDGPRVADAPRIENVPVVDINGQRIVESEANQYITLYKGVTNLDQNIPILPGGLTTTTNPRAGIDDLGNRILTAEFPQGSGQAFSTPEEVIRHVLLGDSSKSNYSSWTTDIENAKSYIGTDGEVVEIRIRKNDPRLLDVNTDLQKDYLLRMIQNEKYQKAIGNIKAELSYAYSQKYPADKKGLSKLMRDIDNTIDVASRRLDKYPEFLVENSVNNYQVVSNNSPTQPTSVTTLAGNLAKGFENVAAAGLDVAKISTGLKISPFIALPAAFINYEYNNPNKSQVLPQINKFIAYLKDKFTTPIAATITVEPAKYNKGEIDVNNSSANSTQQNLAVEKEKASEKISNSGINNFEIFMQTTNDNGKPINRYGSTLTELGCAPSTSINILKITEHNPNPQNIIDTFYWSGGSKTSADATLLSLQQNGFDHAVDYGLRNRMVSTNDLTNYSGLLIYGGTVTTDYSSEKIAHVAGFDCKNGVCYSIDSYFSDGKPIKCDLAGSNTIKCGEINYHVGDNGGYPDALFPIQSNP